MDYVTRDTARVAVVGLLAIAALAMGAATIQTTVDQGTPVDVITGSGGGGGGGGGAGDQGGGNGTGLPQGGGEGGGIVADLQFCVEPLAAWYGTAIYFGAVLGLLYGIKRRYNTGTSVLAMYGVAPVVLTAYFLTTQCGVGGGSTGEPGDGPGLMGNGTGIDVIPTDIPPAVILGVFGLALVVTVAVVFRASGDQDVGRQHGEEEEEADQPHVSDLAAAAGAAADRLEKHNADVDNEVYRAWWEMTSLLNVPKPEAATPGEFAEAAIEVGLDEEDVSQLTTLFEEVRYGKRDAESREERALSVFRSIEEEYGDDNDTNGAET